MDLWIGIAGLGSLMASWLLVAWWLFASPLAEPIPAIDQNDAYFRVKQGVVMAFLVAQFLGSTGGQWDVAWHMRYGVVVDDFWWPPHILIYANFGVTALIALYGVMRIIQLPVTIRARFRAEPLLGAMFLFTAYMLLSGPIDEVWHRVYGRDISGLSLPHVVLVLFSLMGQLTVAALQLEVSKQRGGRLGWVAFVPVVTAIWAWVIIMVGDYEMIIFNNVLPPESPVLARAPWTYIIFGLAFGAFTIRAGAALLARQWSATILVVAMNVWAFATFWVLSLFGNPLPMWGTAYFYLAGTVATDGWQRMRAAQTPPWLLGVIFGAAYAAIGIPITYLGSNLAAMTSSDALIAALLAPVVGALSFAAGDAAGMWLKTLPSRISPRIAQTATHH